MSLSILTKARAIRIAPLAIVVILVGVGVAASHDVGRLDPNLSWASPSSAHWLGAGEGGVDLLGVISWGALKGCILAAIVAISGFVIGTPLGAVASGEVYVTPEVFEDTYEM